MSIHPDPDGSRRRALAARQMPARRARRRWLRWVAGLALVPVLFVLLMIAFIRVLPPPTSAFILSAQFEAWRADGDAVAWRWVPCSAIAPVAALAAITAEDQKFPSHHGFDFEAVEHALAERQQGGSVRGASTITQQLAKNLFLWPERSWLRKGLEAALTVLLEVLLPKARILEIYLNIVEFGPGVYGVAAASERYFGHSPATLTSNEAALLAAVLPAPKRWRVVDPSPAVRARQRWILNQMRQLGGVAFLDRLAWPRG